MNFKRIWYFLWKDNSLLSWVVSFIVAFFIVRYAIYPILGLAFGASLPIVAVVSDSMEHQTNFKDGGYYMCGNYYANKQKVDFDFFWEECGRWYEDNGISKEQFKEFDLSNGFNKGDVMILYGRSKINIGDVVVFRRENNIPVIHRYVGNNGENIKTKGDHNVNIQYFEENIPRNRMVGKAIFKVPYLGWLKITVVCGWNSFTGAEKFVSCMGRDT